MNTEIRSLIAKQCKGKPNIKLTVGYLLDGSPTVSVFDESGEIDNVDYIYEIASITKTFTASLIAKYLHEGKLSLDDSLDAYLPNLPKKGYYPTIKRLLTHTSGYARNLPASRAAYLKLGLHMTNDLFASTLYMDEQKMMEILSRIKLSDKDYGWQYSNFGFGLLGYIIGKVSGKGYSATMDEFLSIDLQLQNAYTGACPNKNLPGYNKYEPSGGNMDWSGNHLRSAGDMSATAKDLLRYAEINAKEELPYLSICHKRYAKHSFLISSLLDVDMGLGWWTGRKEPWLMHGGDTALFSSALVADKKRKTAAVVLSNYPNNSMNLFKIAIPLLQNINQSKRTN
jgi:CubicO group peptidase (beta-lactamase class C family)